MSIYRLTPAARRDVDEIWDYTEARWGQDQAVKYVQALRDACRFIASGETSPRPHVGSTSLFRYPVGSHIVFYRRENGAVDVIRILHNRMDPGRHLE